MSFRDRKPIGRKLNGGYNRNKFNKRWITPFGNSFGTDEEHIQNPYMNNGHTTRENRQYQTFDNFGSGSRTFGRGRRNRSARKEENVDEEYSREDTHKFNGQYQTFDSFGRGRSNIGASKVIIRENVDEKYSREEKHKLNDTGGSSRIKEEGKLEHSQTPRPGYEKHPPWLRGKSIDTGGYSRIKEEKLEHSQTPRPGYEKPPPWLRGRAIGLWHRDRYKKMRANGLLEQKKQKQDAIEIHLDESLEMEIRSMLNSIKSEFPYPIQRSIPRPSVMDNLVSAMEWEPSSSTATMIKQEPEEWTEVTYKKEKPVVAIPETKQVQTVCDKYKHLEESAFKRNFLRSITGSIEENVESSLCTTSKLRRDPQLDESLKRHLLNKTNSRKFLEMLEFRKKLPAFDKRLELLKLLEDNQVIVISGETGCGKTTQVAQFILDYEIANCNGSVTHIVCTQPRRISAVSVAERVAQERDEICGENSVGYQIRLERQIPKPQGSILFCTTGILITKMVSDPALREISHLVLDEIHERDTICDFVITILKDVIPKRPDLKVILMSATLNAENFSKYYFNCPMLHIPGFTFPVQQYYLEDVLELLKYSELVKRPPQGKNRRRSNRNKDDYRSFQEMIGPYIRLCKSENRYSNSTLGYIEDPNSEDINLELILVLLEHICLKEADGAILVFLPGWDKISILHKLIQSSRNLPLSKCLIIPLHSMMPTIQQKSVFNRPPPGVRKIVIATNIAETSITIDDIVYVVDCGKIKMHNFDLTKNISTLQEEWVSIANATQRKGRAGRVQKGVCYHLFTRAREQLLSLYPLPEMLRTRLEEVILQAKLLQVGYVTPFLQKVMDPPDPKAIQISLELLITLNALDEDENLTPLGYHLSKLPLDPQTGKMILMGAIFSCVDPIFSVAASLSFKDAFIIPLEKEKLAFSKKIQFAGNTKSDHLAIAEAISGWEEAENRGYGRKFANENFLSHNTISLLCDMKNQFGQHLCDMKFLDRKSEKDPSANRHSNNVGLIKAIICAGLYPNVAIIKKVKVSKGGFVHRSILTPEDGNVKLHIKSVNNNESEFESRFLMYHLKLKSTSVFLHDTTMVFPLPLLFFGQKFEISIEDDEVIINVSRDIRFTCLESTALLIKELRQRLDWLLEQKVSHPGITNWSCESDEGIILRAIIKLISYEEKELTNSHDLESESDEYIEYDGNCSD